MIPKYIIIHHTAISRNLNKKQFDAVDRYHRNLGWGKIGYHYMIEPDGLIRRGRRDDEVGAHCKEQSMNFRSLGVCLTGNFDVEEPTNYQIFALRDLLQFLCRKYKITMPSILFHRNLATYKSCPGKNMSLQFVRGLSVKGD